MSNNKQSSVEWLKNEFSSLFFDYLTFLIDNKRYNERHKEIIEQAKAKQRGDMIGLLEWMNDIAKTDPMRLETDNDDIVDMYYNETFGGEK